MFYLLENNSDENENNIEMFIHLSLKISQDVVASDEFYDCLRPWQKQIFENYIKQQEIRLICA